MSDPLIEARARIAALEAELGQTRARDRLLTSVLESAPDFVAQVTLDGALLFLNRYALGYVPDDVLRKTVYEFTEPADHAVMRAALAQAVATRSQQAYETIARGAHGEPRPYFTRVAPLIEDGEVTSLVLIATDVTRLKQAEAAFAESQATLKHVLDATGMGMWWWDRDRDAGGRDAATSAIFGFDDTDEDRLEPVMSRIHPEDRDEVLAQLRGAYERGDYGPIEHRVVRPDGSIRWVSANGRLMTTNTGPRLVGGALDITARKQLEAQLAQAQKMESIGRLAGGIAHDFNNMLTAILSYNEFALAALPAGSPIAHDLGEVRAAAERSVALTSQLLAFARQQVIAPTVADLNAIVRRVEGLLQRVLGETIAITTRLDARGCVRVDVNQFERVLLNLTTNARDAMPTGGQLAIDTADVEHPGSAELPPGTYVVLAVSDTGAGIAASDLGHVFEPFFTTKAPGLGTGLGLATCYGIVAQNHGHIEVESQPGAGATFRVYLPVIDEAPVASPPPPAHAAVRGTETVLVVEDEPRVRAVAIQALEHAGYRVLAAADGNAALALALDDERHTHIDLLVTDVVMPQLGGVELAARLTAARPGLGVLFVSGYTDDGVIHHGVGAGGVELLHKPFAPAVLTARVRQILDRRRG